MTGLYHRSAQVWAAGALLAMLLPPGVRLGWWLPLHLALAGAVSQSIVGGQFQFSSALAMAPPSSPVFPLVRLGVMNVGALLIVLGRVIGSPETLVVGAAALGSAILWAAVAVDGIWRRSIVRRFPATRGFYLLASVSMLGGAALGAVLGGGAFQSGEAYLSHRLTHMSLNLFGWAGLTILGTLITFLPTVLHVRVPAARAAAATPAVIFCGLGLLAAGLAAGFDALATAGGLGFAAGLALFGRQVFGVLRQRRPRAVPVVARHLFAGLGWLAVVTVVQVPLLARGDAAALRDLWVVGIGGGLVLQAVIGSWAFLLPMSRPTTPARKGRELVAFEVGARAQVLAYNAGLALVLLALRGFLPGQAGAAGIALAWSAAAWALAKTVVFPMMARQRRVHRAAEEWWSPRDAGQRSAAER
ncbi:MAG: hypothetical protein WEB06_10765 [Actinomycetota bacterium]